MKNTALASALATLDELEKSVARVSWIDGIYWDFVEAYVSETAPVSSAEKAEVKRLERRIAGWLDRAKDKYHFLLDEAIYIEARIRSKKFAARFEEVMHKVAIYEGVA